MVCVCVVCSRPRVLQSMWSLLLQMILDTVAENRGVQEEFYNRFQYTVEVSTNRGAALPRISMSCPAKLLPDLPNLLPDLYPETMGSFG